MSLKKRIVFFAIGLLIGIVFVKIIFDKKDVSFDYLPNDRVLKTLRTKARVFDKEALNFFEQEQIDTANIQAFLTDAVVDFENSKQREKPCNFYEIHSDYKDFKIGIQVKNCDTLVTIQQGFKIIEK